MQKPTAAAVPSVHKVAKSLRGHTPIGVQSSACACASSCTLFTLNHGLNGFSSATLPGHHLALEASPYSSKLPYYLLTKSFKKVHGLEFPARIYLDLYNWI